MSTIVLRADTPNGLTNAQVDANFTNLNNDKVETADCTSINLGNRVVKRDSSGDFASRIITCVDLNSSSDFNLKENISNITNGLDTVKQMQGVKFSMKNDDTHRIKLGLIAQDVEKVLPEVIGRDYDDFRTVAYQNIVAVLIEAVKELSTQVEELNLKIAQK
jgi:hypothetical protein